MDLGEVSYQFSFFPTTPLLKLLDVSCRLRVEIITVATT